MIAEHHRNPGSVAIWILRLASITALAVPLFFFSVFRYDLPVSHNYRVASECNVTGLGNQGGIKTRGKVAGNELRYLRWPIFPLQRHVFVTEVGNPDWRVLKEAYNSQRNASVFKSIELFLRHP